MSRIRSIHPGLFTDEAFVVLSPMARIFFMGLWTECDDNGSFEWSPLKLKMRLLPADAVDAAALLAEIESERGVLKYEISGKSYGAVRNFCQFQRPKKPNSVHPQTVEVQAWVNIDARTNRDGPEPVGNQLPTPTEKPSQMEDGGDNKEFKKSDTNVSQRAPDQPIGEAIDVFNEVAASAGWPRVERRTAGRQAALRTRLREDGLDGWRDALNQARASPFLGSDPPPSFVSFDWLIKPANFAKLIEGNYNRGHQSNIREINPNSTLAAILRSEAEAERENCVDYPEARPALPTKLIGRG